MKKFRQLAITNPGDLCFGQAPHPVMTRRGLLIGGGQVYPELNFTLPTMELNASTFNTVQRMYAEIVEEACQRALELDAPGLVIEFETLIEMTLNPTFAVELTKIINDILERHHATGGLKSALRITPNDTREMDRPPKLRSGILIENMFRTFEQCALAGAELLSIESTGGKEVHDDALMMCDLELALFALSVLGVRDMAFLWERINAIAAATGTIAAGDTACGFGNTAMVLAEKRFIPRVFAAVIRVMSIVRSLVAYEQGAVGPGKDCGYENPFLKVITGYPMAMEGKTAACAHLSPLGNIASAACDLWSNESVQNIKLLGGMAPTVCLEQLVYDCRLMNQAARSGGSMQLRDWLVDSDATRDPQAFILAPANVVRISQAVVDQSDPYLAARTAAMLSLQLMKDAWQRGDLLIPSREIPWLDRLAGTLADLPDTQDDFIDRMSPQLEPSKVLRAEYQL